MSVAPHSTVNPVVAVTVFIAGDVVIVPPCAFKEIITVEVASIFALGTLIVPPPVHMNVPRLGDATERVVADTFPLPSIIDEEEVPAAVVKVPDAEPAAIHDEV